MTKEYLEARELLMAGRQLYSDTNRLKEANLHIPFYQFRFATGTPEKSIDELRNELNNLGINPDFVPLPYETREDVRQALKKPLGLILDKTYHPTTFELNNNAIISVILPRSKTLEIGRSHLTQTFAERSDLDTDRFRLFAESDNNTRVITGPREHREQIDATKLYLREGMSTLLQEMKGRSVDPISRDANPIISFIEGRDDKVTAYTVDMPRSIGL